MYYYKVYQQYIIKVYQRMSKGNHYQVYQSSLHLYINSVSSV